MMKRMLSLVLIVMTLMTLGITAASAKESKITKMYVYTENGGDLNIREEPRAGSHIISRVPYGTELEVVKQDKKTGWTKIVYGAAIYSYGYVQSRYLVKKKPAPLPVNPPKPATQEVAIATSSKDSVTVTEMNRLLKSAQSVVPYTITVRPTRASGWVTVRWVPSKNSIAQATYPEGAELTVIAALKDWYQVQDPDTGAVGYLYKSYVVE